MQQRVEECHTATMAIVDLGPPQLLQLADGATVLFKASNAGLHRADQVAGPRPLLLCKQAGTAYYKVYEIGSYYLEMASS